MNALQEWSFVQYAMNIAPVGKDRSAEHIDWVHCVIKTLEEGLDGRTALGLTNQKILEAVQGLMQTEGQVDLATAGNDEYQLGLHCHVYHDTCIVQVSCIPTGDTRPEELWDQWSLKDLVQSSETALFAALFQANLNREALRSEGYGLGALSTGCRALAAGIGASEAEVRTAKLKFGWLGQVSDGVYLLASRPNSQTQTDRIALDVLPRMELYRGKVRLQKQQFDALMAVLRDEEAESHLNQLPEDQRGEWSFARGVVADLERTLAEVLRLMRDKEEEIAVAGSRESRELHEKIGLLGLRYSRFFRELSRAAEMSRLIEINLANYSSCCDELPLRGDQGLLAASRKVTERIRSEVEDTVFFLNQLAERTKTVLETTGSRIESLRGAREEAESRLQSAQTCLIAAAASALGLLSLIASDERLRTWPTVRKLDLALLAGATTLTVGHVVFNLKRANTWWDRLCFALPFGVGGVTLGHWLWPLGLTVAAGSLGPWWSSATLFVGGAAAGCGLFLLGEKWACWWRDRRE
jgi:hypothetical protein